MKNQFLYPASLAVLLVGLGWGLTACRKCSLKECYCYDQPTFTVSLDTVGRQWTNEQAGKVEFIWIDTRSNREVRAFPAFWQPLPTRQRRFFLLPSLFQEIDPNSTMPRMEHSRFVIRQPELGLADTIDGIRYDLVPEQRICNTCYPGPSEAYECSRPTRVVFRLNGREEARRASEGFSVIVFRP
jgi:hypothetical protein